MTRLSDIWNSVGAFGKVRESDDPHKQAGGCGDLECRICYTDSGTLKNSDGLIQQRANELGLGDTVSSRKPKPQPKPSPSLVEYTFEPIRVTWPIVERDEDYPEEKVIEEKPTLLNAPDSFNYARQDVEKYILSTKHTVDWSDIVGNDDAKAEMREAIESAHTYKKLYEFYDKKPTKGVLLWGPPGNGKTMLGKAAAHALGEIYGGDVEMLHISGPSIESPLVGMAAKVVSAVFLYAREYYRHFKHPLVIFVDEADSLLKPREWAPWSAELVGAFLSEMDGLEESGAFVVLATNRPNQIDSAILRDGRIGRKIRINRPDENLVKAIAAKNIADKKWIKGHIDVNVFDRIFDPELRLKEIVNPETGAKHFFNFSHIVSNSMVVGIIEDAKGIAFRRDKDNGRKKGTGVTQADVVAAIEQKYLDNKTIENLPALAEFITDIALPAEAAAKELRNYK